MRGEDELRRLLGRIDGRGYPAYKDLRGSYDLGALSLHVDHVQGDPFAAPSRVRVRVPMAEAGLPGDWISDRVRGMALADHLARRVHAALRPSRGGRRGSGRSGLLSIDAGGQEVLERSAVRLGSDFVEARAEVGLPAAGRRILGREAMHLLCEELPQAARQGLLWRNLDAPEAREFVACVELQEQLRAALEAHGLVAFVADGSVLPRESGASDRPLVRGAIPFEAPTSLRVELPLPSPVATPDGERSSLTGLGIPRGVTLVVGGGYHGKSTLLKALERAVYPHVPGDGRERVVTLADAVKIRAEDGRRVTAVDIEPFIAGLPQGRSTDCFETDDASGSTSQAANIVEALEVGTRCLLIDEDTSATNFLIRDARMQALVHRDGEPITPLLDRVRELYDGLGVSTLLVMGGCGDYFDVADTVIWMREYQPFDASADARRVASEHPSQRVAETRGSLSPPVARIPLAESLDPSRGRRDVKIGARGRERIEFGRESIDLRAVEQIVDPSQTRAIGHAIQLARSRLMDGKATLRQVSERLDAVLDAEGLDALDPFHRGDEHPGNYARPRRQEIAAALNRLRSVRMRQQR
ncbi:MAG: ABC-ATPase domain-containing protein [Myxococcota bacterium]